MAIGGQKQTRQHGFSLLPHPLLKPNDSCKSMVVRHRVRLETPTFGREKKRNVQKARLTVQRDENCMLLNYLPTFSTVNPTQRTLCIRGSSCAELALPAHPWIPASCKLAPALSLSPTRRGGAPSRLRPPNYLHSAIIAAAVNKAQPISVI